MGNSHIVKKKSHAFQVFGKRWKVFFCTPQYYFDKVCTGSKGLTYPNQRIMFIDLEHLSEELCRHELTHVYSKELSLVELQLKKDQVEEFYCELVAKHAPQLIKQARTLYQIARKLKWKKSSSS
jgi:hypothetical protein